MIIVLYDNRATYGTFTKPLVYALKGLNLQELHKVLMETNFSGYLNFMYNHCLHSGTPKHMQNHNFIGTFGDDRHLSFKLNDSFTIADVLSGLVPTLEVWNSAEEEADWVKQRLRFMSLQDYHNEIMSEHHKRLREFEEVTTNPNKFYIQ